MKKSELKCNGIRNELKISVLGKTFKRKKRPATDWKKLLANHIPDKWLMFRIQRKFSSSIKTNETTIKTWAGEFPSWRSG